MLRTLEAMIDEQGDIRLLERIRLPKNRRVLVTILEEVPLLGWPIATQEGGLENEIGLQAEFAAWDT